MFSNKKNFFNGGDRVRINPLLYLSWYISVQGVGIATGYVLDDRGDGVGVPVGSRIFSTLFRPALRAAQPPIQWVTQAPSLEVKRPEREAYHSPPTSAEVKKTWIYTSTPPYVFIGATSAWYSSVRTVTSYGVDDRGIGVLPCPAEASHSIRTGSRTHPAIYHSARAACSPGVKRSELNFFVV
jgi:hypothetical protein